MNMKLLLVSAAGLLLTLTPAPAATLYVDAASTNAVPPYADWATAAVTIQDAVDAAVAGDTVLVTNGVYRTGGRVGYAPITNAVGFITNRVLVTNAITLRSVNGPAVTIIEGRTGSGNQQTRCVNLTNGAVLSGFTLTNGSAGFIYWIFTNDIVIPAFETFGGGIWSSPGAVSSNCVLIGNAGGAVGGSLIQCTLMNNASPWIGGGAANATLNYCTLQGNSAERAGGAYKSILNHCTLNGNSAEEGGGGGVLECVLNNCVLSTNSGGGASHSMLTNCLLIGNIGRYEGDGGGADSCILDNCVLQSNVSREAGGGAANSSLIRCTLIDNVAREVGGGAANCSLDYCTLIGNSVYGGPGGGAYESTLRHCLLVGNEAGWGGGAYQSALTNCTLTGNLASWAESSAGGGTYGGILENCIVYHNMAPIGPNYSASLVSYSCTTPAPASGVGNITNAPLFVDTNGWSNLRLQSNSPCINAGNNAYVTTSTDLDGRPRVVGGTVDIGAYEWQGTIRYVSAASTNPIDPYSSWASAAVTIQDAVDAAVAGDEIVVTNGVYQTGERAVYGMSNRVAVTKPVTVRSVNGPEVTSIVGSGPSGPAAVRCVYLTNGAVLAGFTLTNGATPNSGYLFTNQSGGGAWCEGPTATLLNCVITSNKAAAGGGVYGGTLSNCVLTGNFAWDDEGGGGAYGSMLDDCVLTNNLSYYDGGGATASTLNRCVLTKNTSWYESGGGAWRSTLNNCTLTGNDASYGGGASASTLNNCLVVGNAATGDYAIGGGVYGGTNNYCTISGNTAVDGGGASDATLNSCALIGNSAEESGGGASRSTLYNCTLMSNMASNSPWTSATHGGGAAYSTLRGCTLLGNWADWGGGATDSSLSHCVVTGNVARQNGGGARRSALKSCNVTNNAAWDSGAGASQSSLTNCTVLGNLASEFGGGVHASSVHDCALVSNTARYGGGAFGGTLSGSVLTGNHAWDNEGGGGGAYDSRLTNCIVFYNSTIGVGDNYAASTLGYSCTTPAPTNGVGNITNAPLFVDTNGWSNLRLQPNSPCINAGHNAYVTTSTSWEGVLRIAGGTVDMGPYEFQSPASTISYAWLQQFGLPTDGSADAVDTDLDSHNNWQEWMAGTEPTNALSALRLAAPLITPTNVTLTWTSVSNRTYTLEQSTNLSGAPAFSVLRSNLAGLPGTTSWTDTNAPGVSPRFYQLRVSP